MDSLMQEFFDDICNVFEKEDGRILSEMNKGDKEFYSKFPYGLGVFSSNEWVLKHLVFSSLCSKYKIITDYQYLKSKKLADLVLFSDEDEHPDALIEMKWAKVKKDGTLDDASVVGFIDDFVKMRSFKTENTDIKKYFMQFVITANHVDSEVLKEGFTSRADLRVVNKDCEIVYTKAFLTDRKRTNIAKNNCPEFHLIVWEIMKSR